MISVEKVAEVFKNEKIRFTPQRQYIIEELIDNRMHPTVNDIYLKVRERYSNISLSTVYQTLALLQRNGLLNEFKTGELSHYDPIVLPHAHGICSKCGAIVDLNTNDKTPIEKEKFRNFNPTSKEVTYKGHCNDCK